MALLAATAPARIGFNLPRGWCTFRVPEWHTFRLPGSCPEATAAAIDAVGFFDERYFFFFEETDWARQMCAAGWKVFCVPTAFIYHLQGQSIGRNIRSRIEFYRSRYQYFQKWESRPYYLTIRAVILLRLLINGLLTSLGVLLTLGLHRGLRDKWAVYGNLLGWHFRRCP